MYYQVVVVNQYYGDFILLKTRSESEAIERAQDEQYYIERDKRKNERVEVRAYSQDIDDEECTCFNYTLIDWGCEE